MASRTYSTPRFKLTRRVRNWLHLVRLKHFDPAGYGRSRRG